MKRITLIRHRHQYIEYLATRHDPVSFARPLSEFECRQLERDRAAIGARWVAKHRGIDRK